MPHLHELYDFTVSFAVVHNGKILLVHHKKLGLWMQPGGHIELDEEPTQTLWRELEEETGLTENDVELIEIVSGKVTPSKGSLTLPLPFDINVHHYDDTHQHIDLCYLLVSKTDTVRLEEEGAHDIGWFTFEQVETMNGNESLMDITLNRSRFAIEYTGSLLQ